VILPLPPHIVFWEELYKKASKWRDDLKKETEESAKYSKYGCAADVYKKCDEIRNRFRR